MKIRILREGKMPMPTGNVGVSLDDPEFFREGKLLAEKLENRAFGEGLMGYSPYPEESGVEIKLSADRPLFPETPNYLRLSALSGGKGLKNRAFGGIDLKAGNKYEISFYARSYDFKGNILARVQHPNGQSALEKKFKVKPDGKWHRYVFRKKVQKDCTGGQFVLLLSSAGTVHFDWLSLLPLNAIKGLFRRDVFESLHDFKPGFLRFTGSARLKETLAIPQRRQSFTTQAGFYELLLFAEALCCKPLPVLKVSGRDEAGETAAVFALVEFALGGAETEWGSLRAEMGHPQPFALEYLSFLPEEGEDERIFERLAEKLHEKYPALNLVAPAREGQGKYDHFYAREEVLYRSPEWLLENAHRYDGQPRGRRLIVSFAATERGALAEAAFMTGIEQNADLILGACRLALTGDPAYKSLDPLLSIGREAGETPGLSVQKLFSLYTGNTLLKVKIEGAEGVYASASEREGGLTFVKIVNASASELEAEIEGDERVGELNRIVLMQEDPVDGSVVPFEIAPSSAKSLHLPPRSFSVIVLRR